MTSVADLTGESARIASWVNTAWEDIQTAKEDWQWMREPVEFNTVSEQQIYTPTQTGVGATFGNWKRDSFRTSSVGQQYRDEQLMNYMEWTTFRNLYIYANMRYTYTRPVVVAIDPDKNLAFGAIPNQPFVITGEYYTKPVLFSANTDAPSYAFPERFHMMIVYRAMMFYAGYEAAPEVYARGELEFKRLMNRLTIDQLPTLVSGPPLA